MIAAIERMQKEIEIQEVLFAGFRHRPEKKLLQILPIPRLIIPLSGQKWTKIAMDSHQRKIIMKPGQVLFCPPFGWVETKWHLDSEIISVVFHNDYLRVLYIDQKDKKQRLVPDIFYHTNKPINQTGSHLVHALELMENAPEFRSAAKSTVEALLELVLVDVKNSVTSSESISRQTWKALVDYLGEHATESIGRAELAEEFQLHPSYISRLFRNYAGTSFQDYLADIRMRFAAKLLSEPGSTVNETAKQCGYKYTSYFIKAFKKHSGISPGQYRSHKK
ncbi:MAG: AraC family transcriptional regulator [Phycisphaerae bacterium]|nr:AraC family transcriptional regulator [Phycisphaerae bacterium]